MSNMDQSWNSLQSGKGARKEPPQKEMTSKGKYGKAFWNWSSFAWLRTVRCLWRALQGGSAKLECCKLPWLHQPARCEKLYTMWDIMPTWSMIIMIQYDPMIMKLSASVQVCPGLDVWGKSRLHSKRYTRYTRLRCRDSVRAHRACHLGQFARAAQGSTRREQEPKIIEPRKQNAK